MKINWKLRFQNKATLTAMVLAVVAFVYQMLGIFGIIPPISQDSVISAAGAIINLLVLLGVVVDPTTSNLSDSANAMTYDAPAPNITSEGLDEDDDAQVEEAIALEENDDEDEE